MSSNEAGIAKVKELDRSSNAVVPELNGLPSKVPPERVLAKAETNTRDRFPYSGADLNVWRRTASHIER